MSFPGLNAKTKMHLWSADRPFLVLMQQRIVQILLSFPGLNAKTKVHLWSVDCIYGVQMPLWSADRLLWCSRE